MVAKAVIDLAALRHNLSRVKCLAPNAAVMSVIKSDAYGHGGTLAAKALSSSDAFAVARLNEALDLRQQGIRGRIVLLEGPASADEWPIIANHKLEAVVHADWQLQSLAGASVYPASVWIKIDTGMHRLGFDPGRVAEVQSVLDSLKDVAVCGWMTHLARSDEPKRSESAEQVASFVEATASSDKPKSVANSAAILTQPAWHFDWVRPGIMLYGVSPIEHSFGADYGLKPVMTLSSRIIAIRTVEAGDSVGYGGRWVASRQSRIATVAIGYGDGYPRHCKDGTPVLVNGVRALLAGRVSMDMITVDLASVPSANVGDEVTLWGGGLAIEEVAEHADTIAYELLCQVTNRVPRVYEG